MICDDSNDDVDVLDVTSLQKEPQRKNPNVDGSTEMVLLASLEETNHVMDCIET